MCNLLCRSKAITYCILSINIYKICIGKEFIEFACCCLLFLLLFLVCCFVVFVCFVFALCVCVLRGVGGIFLAVSLFLIIIICSPWIS